MSNKHVYHHQVKRLPTVEETKELARRKYENSIAWHNTIKQCRDEALFKEKVLRIGLFLGVVSVLFGIAFYLTPSYFF